ncbi:hypothetical protein [Xanthobacter sediminis]
MRLLPTILGREISIVGTPFADGDMIHVTASVGVAIRNGHPDYALHAAERGGRNRTVILREAPAGMP